MARFNLYSIFKSPITIGITVFLFIFCVTQFITYQKYLLNIAEQNENTNHYLEEISDKIEGNLNDALNAAKTLSFLVENFGIPKSFDSLGQKLIDGESSIYAIQLLKNGIITHNYPDDPNNSVIGYNVMEDSLRNKELLKAFKEDGFYFGGPFKLRQGGFGIVGRVPIKTSNDSLNFAAVVIQMNDLIQSLVLKEEKFDYQFEISKINPNTGKEEFFIHKNNTFSAENATQLFLPQGDWKVYVKPNNSFIYNELWQTALLGLFFALTSGVLAWFIVKQPRKLQLKVEEQTKLITDTKNKFENLVENSLGSSLIIDETNLISYASSSIKHIIGYTENEVVGLSILDLIHPEDKTLFSKQLKLADKHPTTTLKNLFFRIQHKNKSWRWLESNITNLKQESSTNGIVLNFKDTTDRKLAEDLNIKEKALLNTVINSLPGIFYLFNTEGQFLLWNKNFEEVSGYSNNEIAQMHPLDFFDAPEQPYLESRIQETFETGQSFAETYFFTKDKRKIYFYFTGVTINFKGETCLLGTGIDFSERKKAVDELVKSEQEMISIFNSAIDAVIVMDIEGNIKNWNPKAETTFGWTANEAIGKKLSNLIIPEQHRIAHKQGMHRYKSTGQKTMLNRTVEITALNKKGEEFEVSLGISNANFSGKEYFIGFIADISERKINERLKEFERKDKEALINSTQDLMWSVSEDFKLLAANEAFHKETNKYSYSEMKIGDYVLENRDASPKEYIELWRKLYERGLKGENFTNEIIVPASDIREESILETHFNPIIINGKVEGVACYSRDITERRRIKNQLLDINKKLTTAQEIGKIGYWELNFLTNELFWSDEVYAIWEVDKQSFNLSSNSLLSLIHKDVLKIFKNVNDPSVKEYKPLNIEHKIKLPDGNEKWVHERGNFVFDTNKQPIRFEGIVQDIDNKKLAQIEIEEQNKFIKSAIEHLPIGIAVNNISDGKMTLMNKTFADIYGWPVDEISQVESFFEKVYPDPNYRKNIKEQVLSDMASGNPARMNWDSVKITTKKGQERIVNAKNIPLFDQDLMISSVLDVTEKALAEQKLILSNERFQYVSKATFDVVWDWDLVNNEVYWGDGMKTVFGYKKFTSNVDEAIKKIHPDDVEEMMSSLNNLINNKQLKNWTHEYRFLKADNTYAYVKNRGVVIRNMNREGIRMIGAIRDISLQKEYEQNILDANKRLRNLTDHLQNAREEERIYIAREIHDELGQRLTGIKLDASWIKNKIQTIHPESTLRIERLIEGVNDTINKVRKLATNLRPGVLDDLGLEAAIEWHLEQFKTQTKMQVKLKSHGLKNQYHKSVDTAAYRIFQEALTNVVRHANATKVNVLLYENKKILHLHIADNGEGITRSKKVHTFSLGITGMRERAEMLGGTFTINKQSKGGTIVKVTIPVD